MATPLPEEGTLLQYAGIAVAGTRVPVWAGPTESGSPVGYLVPGGYVPHFRATDDHAWLEATMHDGATAWLRNDPARVTVNLPDPTGVRLVIDPGHGGSEMGALASGLVEKDLNFDIAFWKLNPRLAADTRIERIWYTRNGDYDVSLRYRWDLATAAMAALFLSVHLNAAEDPRLRGTETFYKCGTEAGPVLAAHSRRAACLIHRRQQAAITAAGCAWNDGGVICRRVSATDRRTYYYVLENANVPAVLTETLYLSNPDDARCLADNAFRDRLAQGLYNGVTDYLFGTAPGTDCRFRELTGI